MKYSLAFIAFTAYLFTLSVFIGEEVQGGIRGWYTGED
jgi:hypothetical protein